MSYILEVAKSIKNIFTGPLEYQFIKYGGKALYVEGFLRVTLIGEEKIEFLLKKGTVTIEGKKLNVAEITAGSCVIEGEIEGVYES